MRGNYLFCGVPVTQDLPVLGQRRGVRHQLGLGHGAVAALLHHRPVDVRRGRRGRGGSGRRHGPASSASASASSAVEAAGRGGVPGHRVVLVAAGAARPGRGLLVLGPLGDGCSSVEGLWERNNKILDLPLITSKSQPSFKFKFRARTWRQLFKILNE